jgi:hypothetical protein
MKKIPFILLAILALTLTACSGTATATPTGFTRQGDPGTGTMPPSMELLIGTLKLDGTAQAITTEQAKALLPLWQVYQDLSSSDNAAQAEIDALVEQIQGTMTSEQMQAITDMKLTRQEMFTSMQELGITTGRQPGTSGGGNNGFMPDQDGGGGGFQPGGGPGPGGGGPPDGGQNLSPDQIATAQARRSQDGGGGFNFNSIPPGLFDALIQYLEKVADK